MYKTGALATLVVVVASYLASGIVPLRIVSGHLQSITLASFRMLLSALMLLFGRLSQIRLASQALSRQQMA